MANTPRPPTSSDVARLAGVSRTTVSYVLNDIPDVSIKQETRDRVLAAARELDYQVQPAARALRKGQSDEIYVVADRPITLFMRDLIRVYQRRARELGYKLVVCFDEALAPESRRDFLLWLFSMRPAGVIALWEMITPDEIELARSKGVGSFVSMIGEITPATVEIEMHLGEIPRLVTEHLLAGGHKRLGLIAPQASYLRWYVQSRLKEMKATLAKEGVFDLSVYPVSSATLEEARRVVRELRNDPSCPTAIYGYNDEYCFPLLRALHEQGMRVPDDIAIAGTDNLAFGEMTTPSLTTVSQNLEILGTRLIDFIHHQLISSDENPQLGPLTPPTLIHREST